MARNVLTFLLLLLAPLGAQAQGARYCDGAVVADHFDTRVTPGSPTRAEYFVTLRNTQSAMRRVQVVVTASMIDRPSPAPTALPAGQLLRVRLGYQILSGNPALRGEALANVTRVSCV